MNEDLSILSKVYRLARELNSVTAKISAEYGLTFGQFAVLEALNRKGAMNVGEIKKAILSSDGTVPVIINNLLKMNLVTKTKNSDDKRFSIINLTDKGRALIQKVGPENKRLVHEKLSAWNDTEKQILLLLVNKFFGENISS